MEKKQKYKIRQLPANIYFFPYGAENGEKGYAISFNGGGYPRIEEAVKMQESLDMLIKKMEEVGQENLDIMNKAIAREQLKNMREEIRLANATKKNKELAGYIYIVKSKGFYKIGRTRTPKYRLKFYKTENPFVSEIILQKKVDDYVRVETELIQRFSDKRHRGEWFNLNQEDIKWIKQNI